MTATEWAPAYELHSDVTRVAAAYMVEGTLDSWFTQPYLPVAQTQLSTWMMDELSYVPPAPGGGEQVPTTGQIYPR